jgi:hypothetical protein
VTTAARPVASGRQYGVLILAEVPPGEEMLGSAEEAIESVHVHIQTVQ